MKRKPNIILILADDYGYMDIRAYAEKTLGTKKSKMYYETSHLDRMVAEGIAFSRAYANQICSPTRASILTGKYAGRLGFSTASPIMPTYCNQNMKAPGERYPHEIIQKHGRGPATA